MLFDPGSSLILVERRIVVTSRPEAPPVGTGIDSARHRTTVVDSVTATGERTGGHVSAAAGWAREQRRSGSTREVAIVSGGPDDSWEDRDETRTEDVGLPDHEGDETRAPSGTTFEDDAAEVANMSDSGLTESGLPAHEDDRRRVEDTASGEQNP